MGLYNASFHLGLVAGPGLGLPLALAAGLDPFWSFAGLGLTAVGLVGLFVREPEPRAAEVHGPATRPGPNRGLWVVAAGLPLFGAVYGVVVSCLPVYLISAAGFTRARCAAIHCSPYLGIGAGPADTAASSRTGSAGRASWSWGSFFSAAGDPVHLGPAGLFAAVVGVLGLGLGFFSIASLAFLCERAPRGRAGAVYGLYYAAWGGGYFLGRCSWTWSASTPNGRSWPSTRCWVAVMITVRLWPRRR
jgi:hypothetical protein